MANFFTTYCTMIALLLLTSFFLTAEFPEVFAENRRVNNCLQPFLSHWLISVH
jgi:hypothetical protein